MDALSYALKLDNSSFTGALDGARGGLAKLESGIGSVLSAGAKLAGIGAGFAATAAGAATFKAFNLAKDMEQTSVAFRTMVGDGKQAEELLGRLKKLGADTPFDFPELADAGRKLLAFGEEADTIPDSLRRIGDVASGIQAPIGEIAEIYGKARVQGTLFAEDINQLTGRGIPVLQEFAKITGKSVEEIKGMASEGQITFPMLEQAFMNLTADGGKFHGMMQEQSKTSAGLLSTLGDAVNEALTAFGQPINEAIKPWLEDAVELAGRVPPIIANGLAVIQGAIANGSIGDMVLEGLKLGFMTGTNYGVGAIRFLGDLLFDLFEFSLRRVFRFFSGGMTESFANIFEGAGTMLLGFGKLVTARLAPPFLEIAAFFEAGLTKGIEEVLAMIGRIPVLGEKLGLDDLGRQGARAFAEIHDAAMNAWVPKNLDAEAADLLRKGMEQAGKGISQLWEGAADDFQKSFDNLEFKPMEIFKAGELEKSKETLAALGKAANPEAWEKLQDAMDKLNDPLGKAAATAGDVGKEMANGLNTALGSASKIQKKLDEMLSGLRAAVANFGKPDNAAIDKRAKEFEAAGADPKKARRLAESENAVGKAGDKVAGSRREQIAAERADRDAERMGKQIARAAKYLDKTKNLDEKSIGRMSRPAGISEEAWKKAKDIAGTDPADIAGKVDKAGKGAAGARPEKREDPAKPARDSATALEKLLAEVQQMRARMDALVTA